MEIKLSEEMLKMLAFLAGLTVAGLLGIAIVLMMRAEYREEKQRAYNLNLIQMQVEGNKTIKKERRR